MSAPLTLAEVREIATENAKNCSYCGSNPDCDACGGESIANMSALIEWLVEQVNELDCDSCGHEGSLCKWLRGEA